MQISILFGGVSAEKDVSISSAIQISNALRSEGHSVTGWFMNREAKWQKTMSIGGELEPKCLSFSEFASRLQTENSDLAFPVMHGVVGEDGRVQSALEWIGIPYVGSGLLASAVCLNKDVCKRLVQSFGIPVVPWVYLSNPVVDSGAWIPEFVLESTSSKFIVKPNDSGSSIGIALCQSNNLHHCVENARTHSHSGVIVEAFVDSKDVEVPIVEDGKSVLAGTPCMMIVEGELFDFALKYESPLVRQHLPNSRFSSNIADMVTRYALTIFEKLNLRSVARIDFLATNDGQVFFNEVNTMPYLTNESCIFDGIGHRHGMSYNEMIVRIARSAVPNSKCWKRIFGKV